MKMNKNLKKISFMSLLFASVLLLPDYHVDAETWKSSWTNDGTPSYITPVGDFGGGPTFKLTNGTVTYNEVYCSDPGVNAPKTSNYTAVTLPTELQAGYNAICNANVSSAVKVDAIKGYAFNHDKSRQGGNAWSEAVMNYVYNGTTCTLGKNDCPGNINSETVQIKNNLQAVKDVIKLAEEGNASVSNIELSGKVEGNMASYTLNANGVPGVLIIDSAYSGTLSINGEVENNVKYRSISIDEMAADATIKITFKINCNEISADDAQFSLSYKYKESDSSDGYIAKGFHANDSDIQNLIACVPQSGATCEPDASGNCSLIKNGVFQCEEKSCDPEVTVGSLSDGAALCDANGTTLVKINEIPDEKDILACVGDGYDELGNNIDVSSQLLDNDKYCSIYCYEDYSLTLPGPNTTLDDSDESLFINAGSYFTINGELSSKNEVKCITIKDIDAYKQDILAERTKVVTAYNNYAIAEAAAKTTCQEKSDPIYDSEGNITGYDKYLLVTTPSRKEMSMNGDSYKTTTIPGGTTRLPGSSCSNYEETSSTEEKANLEKVITKATENIADYKSAWNSCDKWEFNNLVNSCEAEIIFEYYDGEEFGNPEIAPITPSTTTESYGILGSSQKTSVKDKVCTTAPNCDGANSSTDVIINGRTGNVIIDSKYEFKNEFVIHAETGEVYWANTTEAETCLDKNECYESKGFPVSLDTTQGKYYYQYTFDKIGHYFNEGSCGRLDNFIEEYGTDDAGMKCYYDVNSCEDCDVICEGDGCELNIPNCDGDGCKVACVGGGCILDINSGFLATFRTISLNDDEFAGFALLAAAPNNLLAYNSTKTKPQNESNWETEKGLYTAGTISDAGENIYGNEPEYAITLTPQIINEIKGYNEEAENYLNDTLDCKVSDKYGKCTSTFIDMFFDRNKYEAEFKKYDDSNPGANKPFVGPAWK